jgi:hypothetical protein
MTTQIMHRLKQLETSMGAHNNQSPVELLVQFVSPVDGSVVSTLSVTLGRTTKKSEDDR